MGVRSSLVLHTSCLWKPLPFPVLSACMEKGEGEGRELGGAALYSIDTWWCVQGKAGSEMKQGKEETDRQTALGKEACWANKYKECMKGPKNALTRT